MNKIYKPVYFYLILDNLILLLSMYAVLDWFPLTTNSPFDKYSLPSLYYFITWVICSYVFKRYGPLRRQSYFSAVIKLFYTILFVFLIYWALIYFFYKPYSGYVLLTISIGIFVVNYIFLSIYFAYRLAVEYNDITDKPHEERKNATVKQLPDLEIDDFAELHSTIIAYSGKKVFEYLNSKVNLKSGNTYVFIKNDIENLEMTPNYHFSTIIQLERLNRMRRINSELSIINKKLPDDGVFICCFESKSTQKMQILRKYPKGINYIVYTLDYLFKRVMPKFILTKKLYYFITGGKNRVFSKAEILGRLFCFGFDVIGEKKIGNLTYVFAKRVKQPKLIRKRIYGPLIRLRRLGLDAKPFEVYKMRTMHPYSEYLQGYIFERNNLQDGGKFNKDIRVTTIGRIMRKYWLDELPMIFNLFKGDMKLVGVRPLSKQYFNLYNKDLQEKRVRFKPGLLPPFYADMPHTLTEIQESEMKYLNLCEKNGVFVTDIRYFFLILQNILLKKARSA